MIRVVLYSAFISIGIWIGSMAVDDVHPYVYDAADSRINPDPLKRSAPMMEVDWAIKTNRICPGTTQRFFRDLDGKMPIKTMDTTPKSRAINMGDTRLVRSFPQPSNLPRRVGYSALVCSECNLLQMLKPLCFMTPEIAFRTAD